MIFVKVIVCILLYLAIGIGVNILICRLDDSFDSDISDDTVVLFGSSTIWPLILLMFLCKVFTEKVSEFWEDLIDRIEAIKEERALEEEEDEYR